MTQIIGPDLVLLKRIDCGGMAEIYKAELLAPGGFKKTVAVKRIHPHLLKDESTLSIFCREICLISKLQHPNIVQVFSTGQEENYLYLVMEYVHGKNLDQVVVRCKELGIKFPIPLACFAVREVGRALEYAHSINSDISGDNLNIIHRDVTPRNIMLGYHGEVKLIDFGLARAKDLCCLTESGIFRGTPRYASPEQVQGRELDARTDVYSLGVTFYELLAQHPLIEGSSHYEICKQILERHFPPPSSYQPDIPKALERLIAKAMAKDLNTRHQSATEFYHDLIALQPESYDKIGPIELAEFMRQIFAEEIKQQPDNDRPQAVAKIQLDTNATEVKPKPAGSATKTLLLSISYRKRICAAVFFLLFLASLLYRWKPASTELKNFSEVWSKTQITSPVQISGLSLWLSPESIEAGPDHRVAFWKDTSPAHWLAIQSESQKQPLLVDHAINGLPAVEFDGVDDFLTLDPLTERLRNAEDCSFFFVASFANRKSQYILSAHSKDRFKDIYRMGFKEGYLTLKLDWRSGVFHQAADPSLALNQAYVFTAVLRQGKQGLLYQNGEKRIDANGFAPTIWQNMRYFSIGQEWDLNPSEFFRGNLAELIVYDRLLAATEQRSVENYLAQKYGLVLAPYN